MAGGPPKRTTDAVQEKIAYLIRKGKGAKEAVGAAYAMAKEGRLTKEGKYKSKKD